MRNKFRIFFFIYVQRTKVVTIKYKLNTLSVNTDRANKFIYL